MRAHWKYLKYVLRHKWFVFLECLKLGVPLWIAITHDWDKFMPDEWIPYARYFYGNFPKRDSKEVQSAKVAVGLFLYTREDVERDFAYAWMNHQHRNQHHWQYWLNAGARPLPLTNVLVWDKGTASILIDHAVYEWNGEISVRGPMPDVYRREMLADWRGAGRAAGTPDTKAWYLKNRDAIRLHPETRAWIEQQLGIEVTY